MAGETGNISAHDFFQTANTGVEVQLQEMFSDFAKGDHLLYTDAAGGFNGTTYEINAVGTNPELREWVGSREEVGLRGYKLSATMKTYESTLGIDEDDYDRQGQEAVRRRVTGFLPAVQHDISRLVHAFMIANPDCYDGVSLFSASHPHGEGGANQGNLTSSDVSLTTIYSAMRTMMGLKDERGRALNIRPTTIMCGDLTWPRIMEAVGADLRARPTDQIGGETSTDAVGVTSISNIYKGLLDVYVNPEITDYTAYLIDTRKTAKAVILREVEGLDVTPLIQKTDRNVFYDRKYIWGAKWKAIMCGGAWQVIHKINGSA